MQPNAHITTFKVINWCKKLKLKMTSVTCVIKGPSLNLLSN